MAYDSTLELRNLLQEEVNDSSPDSATQTRYVSLLNRAHKAVVGGGGELNITDRNSPIRRPVVFPWALATQPKTITLLPFQEGSADVTQNSNSVVNCSIDSSTTDLTGWHIRFKDAATVYYISSHSSTTLTLDDVFVDDTEASTSFDVFKLIYTLGSDDILMLTDHFRCFSEDRKEIPVTGSNEMQTKYPLKNVTEGMPKEIAVIAQSGGTFTVQLSHYPKDYERIEIPYVPIPTELESGVTDPIIPNGSGHRVLLVHLAAFYHLRLRDDDRAMSHLKTAQSLFDSLVTESLQNVNANDPNYGVIAPWPGGFSGYQSINVKMWN